MQVIKLFFTALLVFVSGHNVASGTKLRGVMRLATRRRVSERSLKSKSHQEKDVTYVLSLNMEQQEQQKPDVTYVLPLAVEEPEEEEEDFTYLVVSPYKASKQEKHALCSYHEACAALGLIDNCCPAKGNVMLDCCDAKKTDDEVAALVIDQQDNTVVALAVEQPEDIDLVVVYATSSPTASPASCSVNSECAALGLTGMCCPTTDNVTLACCV